MAEDPDTENAFVHFDHKIWQSEPDWKECFLYFYFIYAQQKALHVIRLSQCSSGGVTYRTGSPIMFVWVTLFCVFQSYSFNVYRY